MFGILRAILRGGWMDLIGLPVPWYWGEQGKPGENSKSFSGEKKAGEFR
jgi:hypothetical protein